MSIDFGDLDLDPMPIEVPDGTLICEECGTSFEHSGRGRKPKRCLDCREKTVPKSATRKPRAGTAKQQATAVLESMYRAVNMGLMMFSPAAQQVWNAQLDGLRASNDLTLDSDPKLCAQIAKLGRASGSGMFYVSHIMAIAPVVFTLREDLASRKAEQKNAKRDADNGTEGETLEDVLHDSPLGRM